MNSKGKKKIIKRTNIESSTKPEYAKSVVSSVGEEGVSLRDRDGEHGVFLTLRQQHYESLSIIDTRVYVDNHLGCPSR